MSALPEFKPYSDIPAFDPVDRQQLILLGSLPASRRVRIMLDARELAVGLIRGRLRRQYPSSSDVEINLKLLEELNRDH